MNLRDWRVFTPLVMAGYVIARFLSILLHEVAGHGLAATMAGGSFYGVYASPGPGFAYIFLPFDSSPSTHAATFLAGFAVTLAAGGLLFLLYRRIHDNLGRLLTLIFLKVLIFQTAVYMAAGAFQDTADTGAAAKLLDAPALSATLLVVGLVLAILAAYWISRKLLDLLAPEFSLMKWDYILLLFWIFPPLVSLALGAGWAYTALYIGLAIIMIHLFILLMFRQVRQKTAEPLPLELQSEAIAMRDVMAFAIAFLMILATWLTAFGPTIESAHGVLLQEPPIEAEVEWIGALAINLHVQLTRTYDPLDPVNISVEFKYRGIPDLGSPLARQVWNSYDQRAYFPFYERFSDDLAGRAFNITGWNVTSREIEGQVWAGGQTHDFARHVYLNLSVFSTIRLVNVTNGNLTLVINEPFRHPDVEPSNGFIDEVTVGWGGGMRLENYTQYGGSTVPDLITGELRWQNTTFEDSPDKYVVTVSLT